MDSLDTLFIMLAVFDSVEFYVIAAVVAAAIIAFSAKGGAGGPARQYLLPGMLTLADSPKVPAIELICCDDGSVVLRRPRLFYPSPSPRDRQESRMPSSALKKKKNQELVA